LISKDAEGECFVEGLVEADEKLDQAFSAAADERGVGAVLIGGDDDATNLAVRANVDLAVVLEELRNVGEAIRQRWGLLWLSSLYCGL
jgi:hypothetical protein